MKISALLTSAGINIGLCALFLLLYSILRKQPSNVGVYFGRRLSEERKRREDSFSLDKLVPSAGWIVRAWGLTEDEILSVAGLDAVVFLRMLVFRYSKLSCEHVLKVIIMYVRMFYISIYLPAYI